MFLKSVEIFGFKSFADRTKIEFSEGISALLGPNGCGKSNVVDAIKWVLGEQSTRTLRAEKMEDVIFNGTEGRKALNVAEVVLNLANDEGILPIDMPEISIKRRLFRSGESEYYINNIPAKLKEIRELFFDTGVGKSAYSIMEQGKIDQILSSKPEERRYIFEEAAGITKYKVKGSEAEKKLEKTEENMQQVESILGEVKRSYETLKVQAEKTKTFRELKDRSFLLEVDILLLKLKDLLSVQAEKEGRVAEKQKVKDQTKQEIDSINESLEENLDVVNSMETKLIEVQKKQYGIELEKRNKESQIVMLGERAKEFERQIGTCNSREKTINEKIETLKSQLVVKDELLAEFEKRLKEVDENISTFESSITTSAERIRNNDAEIAQSERDILDLEHLQSNLQEELRSLTDDIVNELDTRLKESGYSMRQRKTIEEAIISTIQGLLISLDGRIKILEDSFRIDHGHDDLRSLLESALKALKEGFSGVDKLRGLFVEYGRNIPAFLDDFLAPTGIMTRKREIDEKLEECRRAVREKRSRIASLREENKVLSRKIDEYRKTLEELRLSKVRMKTQASAIEESRSMLKRDIGEQESALIENAKDIDHCRQGLEETNQKMITIMEEQKELSKEEDNLKREMKDLEQSIASRNKDLSVKEKKLKEKMELLGKVQTQLEGLQLELAELKTEIRTMYDNFRDRYSRELTEFDSRTFEIKASAETLRDQLSEVREEQKKLGQVNLMAPEEFAEVKERYDFLSAQLEDLRKAREDLKTITEQIRRESTELFLDTYEKIKKNFHTMFRRLFGGGRAEIKLVDPDNVLSSGIEIYAQPPGKTLENIELLSGGERSLTAVGLLFATYMVKPSPFCILDEIDAALDESNVGRFVNLLSEFAGTSQFIVITHNKKTVTGAKALLGVTMEESGVSKIITVRLDNAGEEG
ncbi:MAG TPA: AAA family ATPase [Spirochaetia bacterium]|nr:AAA family ATPase [Spirochaetia bacterium]